MPNPSPKVFKKSLLAVAVLSLAGCASAPKMEEIDLSPIGEGILTAGQATAQVGQHAWDVSMYLLGFSDGASEKTDADLISDSDFSDADFLMDEIDQAMLEEDALLPTDTLSRVEIPNATANFDDVIATPSEEDLAIFDAIDDETLLIQPSPIDEFMGTAQAELQPLELATDTTQVAAVEVAPEAAPVEYLHTVAPSETLWDIAKATTGDATNWHVLADVNNLNQNAGVRPGQKLIIPTDMLKAELAPMPAAELIESVEVAATPIKIDTQNISAAMQETVAAPTVVASAETTTPAAAPRLALPTDEITGKAVKLNPKETLWDFAKRTTGDATNWKVIAGHNNFSEKQAVQVRAGQTIMVPEDIVKTDLTVATNAVDKVIATPTANATVIASSTDKAAVQASGELISEAASLNNAPLFADETQPITIVEANFSDPSKQPIKIAAEVQNNDVQQPDLNNIMVSGTYYPKAIYNDADFSSSLLMRVSPGTSLKVSQAIGNWFEVETEKGTGYVHKRDIK